jgi:hypothetical protein
VRRKIERGSQPSIINHVLKVRCRDRQRGCRRWLMSSQKKRDRECCWRPIVNCVLQGRDWGTDVNHGIVSLIWSGRYARTSQFGYPCRRRCKGRRVLFGSSCETRGRELIGWKISCRYYQLGDRPGVVYLRRSGT